MSQMLLNRLSPRGPGTSYIHIDNQTHDKRRHISTPILRRLLLRRTTAESNSIDSPDSDQLHRSRYLGDMLSIFDLFKVGLGPSSSHTSGPMLAAETFASSLARGGRIADVDRVVTYLYGSLGATGKGHGTAAAILVGLEGVRPEEVDADHFEMRVDEIRENGVLNLAGRLDIRFDEHVDIVYKPLTKRAFHPNALSFEALSRERVVASGEYYSVGGGFVVDEQRRRLGADASDLPVPYEFHTSKQLMGICQSTGLRIDEIVLENELALGRHENVQDALVSLWFIMDDSARRGRSRSGLLPGGLNVPRRAQSLHDRLNTEESISHPLRSIDAVSAFAIAVNEENASGGRIVTAPTNGAAGVIPGALHYYTTFERDADAEGIARFLLTAGAIGMIVKEMASISGADVGCQGEIGSACAMASAGLTAALGGSYLHIENAAEIGLEHNLGLTCDPIGGLVQIPCIERNAVAAVKAINASRIALNGNGGHFVSLDSAIEAMRRTGHDMKDIYKETSMGGLAVCVPEC